MSTQKGNTTRTRPQKHQNKNGFKNDLHDKNRTTKIINGLEITNVCIRCKNIIEWKIKYKKYKLLKAPATCVKCHGKNVKHAYHTICSECSTKLNVCPKCGQEESLISSNSVKNVEDLLKSSEVQEGIKALPERRRRTFYRHLNRFFKPQTEKEILEKLKELSLNNSKEDFDFNSDESCTSDGELDD